MHPSKQAIALQTAPTELAVLFVSPNDVDEVHFKYSKANKILKHSFCFGDDFNFMTVTDRSITLYDLALSTHQPKTVKQIALDAKGYQACHYEPFANTLALVDGSGSVTVYYLNMHNAKFKSHSSKLTTYFNLDISLVDESDDTPDKEDKTAEQF